MTTESILIAAIIGIVVLLLSSMLLGNRRTRGMTWWQARRLLKPAADDVKAWAQALRNLLLHDMLSREAREKLADAVRLTVLTLTHLAEVTTSLKAVSREEDNLRSSERPGPDDLRPVSSATARNLLIALLIGDVAVVSAILTAESAQMPLLLALITSLAIAVAQYALGKQLGHAYLKASVPTRVALIVPAVVLAVLGVALGLLREEFGPAWAVLSIMPAVGTAALTVVSFSPVTVTYREALSAWKQAETRFVSAHKQSVQALAGAEEAWSRALLLFARDGVALEQAEAAKAQTVAVREVLMNGYPSARDLVGGMGLTRDLKRLEADLEQARAILFGALPTLAGFPPQMAATLTAGSVPAAGDAVPVPRRQVDTVDTSLPSHSSSSSPADAFSAAAPPVDSPPAPADTDGLRSLESSAASQRGVAGDPQDPLVLREPHLDEFTAQTAPHPNGKRPTSERGMT